MTGRAAGLVEDEMRMLWVVGLTAVWAGCEADEQRETTSEGQTEHEPTVHPPPGTRTGVAAETGPDVGTAGQRAPVTIDSPAEAPTEEPAGEEREEGD